MTNSTSAARPAFIALCIAPLVIIALAAARPLRATGVHAGLGPLLFALTATATWLLARGARRAPHHRASLALAGTFLVAPFALIGLLWVGLGTPWESTPGENVMRYSVLLAAAVLVTVAYSLAHEAMRGRGAGPASTIAASASTLAGAAYVVWISFELGAHAMRTRGTPIPDPVRSVAIIHDTLLFAACALTYASTAALALAMGQTRWLGRRAARIFCALNALLFVFLVIRGLSFPDPTQSATPWYLRPGFVAGIPAIPWIMPYFLGVAMLRRAGESGDEASG